MPRDGRLSTIALRVGSQIPPLEAHLETPSPARTTRTSYCRDLMTRGSVEASSHPEPAAEGKVTRCPAERKRGRHEAEGERDRRAPPRGCCRGQRVDPASPLGSRTPPRRATWSGSTPDRRSRTGGAEGTAPDDSAARNPTTRPQGHGGRHAGHTCCAGRGEDDPPPRSGAASATATSALSTATSSADSAAASQAASTAYAATPAGATAAAANRHEARQRLRRRKPPPHRAAGTWTWKGLRSRVKARARAEAVARLDPRRRGRRFRGGSGECVLSNF